MKKFKEKLYNYLYKQGLHRRITRCNIVPKLLIASFGYFCEFLAPMLVITSPFIIILTIIAAYQPADLGVWLFHNNNLACFILVLNLMAFLSMIIAGCLGEYSIIIDKLSDNKIKKFLCKRIDLLEEETNNE